MFTEEEKQTLVDAIRAAEKNTSGEIRVHIEPTCDSDPVKRAEQVFAQLNMEQTALRNGILFYLAPTSRKFAVIGDAGIHEKVGAQFWDNVANAMKSHFSKSKFVDGLSNGIQSVGDQLKVHFPYQSDDTNELSDEISMG